MFNFIKLVFQKMMDIWNFVLYDLLVRLSPDFLHWGAGDTWWQNALIAAFWLGLYAGVAWVYFKIVGWPVWKILAHFNAYDFKVMPWWHLLLYLFMIVYCGTSNIFGNRSIDITPFVAALPILIHYLVKVKWRVIYFPLLQVVVLAFWFGALFLFLPVAIILLVLMMTGATLGEMSQPERYICPNCGHANTRKGRCGHCSMSFE